jgi:hypothetical protein
MVGDNVLVKLLDDGRENWAGGVGTGGFSGEARDLNEVEAVGCGEELCLGGVDVAGTGEAGDEENVWAFAGGDAFDDDGEAGGSSGDGLAEERLSQEKDAGEEKQESDEAEGCAGGGHG